MTDRIIIRRSSRGHIVSCDPRLVELARRAIRMRWDAETEVRAA